MADFFSTGLAELRYWISSPVALLLGIFQLWMLIHALVQREWLWFFLILVFPPFTALFYFFQVYRAVPDSLRGFELPGAHKRARMKELKEQIHHLDKAHHHLELGDIYFQQGKLAEAEASYRASLEREPQDLDARGHLGQCLLRQNKLAEARRLLEGVCAQDPKHDYGYSLMALAETLTALGEQQAAITVWERITSNHSYARARVQLAELYLARRQPELARIPLQEVLADAPHGPAFERGREKVWVRKARRLVKQLPKAKDQSLH